MMYVTGFLSFQGDMKVRINYNTATSNGKTYQLPSGESIK